MARQTQTMTVLFADITESSRLYHQLGDGAARSAINDCLSMLAAQLQRFDGRLVKTLGDERVRVDRWTPLMTMGRAPGCDLVVTDAFSSQRHCSIRFVRTSFYVIDHSVNGTYITLASGDEVHLLRGETVIEGSGEIPWAAAARKQRRA